MKFKLIGAVSAAVALLTSAAFAEEYPSKTIEVVTHAGNGGGTDVTTRMMMLRARRALKQDMVIVNKKGGGGAAALEYYKTVAADGYTILTFTVGHAAVMAKGQGGMKTPKMLPFDGGAELATQLVAGAVDAGVLNLVEASAQIEAGEICPTVVLADARMAAIGDVPTAKELGIPVSFSTVRGFAVHADTPPAIAEKIEIALLKAMNHTVYQGYLQSIGLDSTSVAGSDVWGPQIQTTVNEMNAALKELGFIE